MARTPTIRHPILVEVERLVLALPREAQRASLERIERLPHDIVASQSYPRDWIVFRVLGERTQPHAPAVASASASATGAAILADLSPLLERVSAAMQLLQRECEGGAFLTPAQLRERWGCSMATLQRMRRAGLVWRRVRASPERASILVARLDVIELFERRDPMVRSRAAKFARLPAPLREKMIRRALRYHARLGWSMHRCAQRLAERFEHSVEGVRQVLRRDPRTRDAFPQKRPMTPRRRGAMLRLARLGVDATRLSTWAHRSPAVVRRELALARAEHLRQALTFLGDAPPDEREPASRALDPLAPESVRAGLRTPWATDLRQLVDEWRSRRARTNVEERELAAAFHVLRARARQMILALDRLHPRAGDLDRIETDLRWSDAILRELVRSQHRLILETIELRAATTAEQLAGPKLLAALRAGVVAASDAAQRFDPTSGGRLAGQTGLSVDRAVTRVVRNWIAPPPTASRRAASVLMTGVVIPDLARLVTPWERWTRFDPRIALAVQAGALGADEAKLLTLRFGLAGEKPRTLAELMAELQLDAIRVAHAESGAVRHALAWARASAGPRR